MHKRPYQDPPDRQQRPRRDEFLTLDAGLRLSMEACDANLRHLAICIKREQAIARDHAFVEQVNETFESLSFLIRDNDGRAYIAWEASGARDIHRSISFHIYNMGALARVNGVRLNMSMLEFILTRLLNQPRVDAKSISNGLYGLGLLAHANRLDGHMGARLISELLTRLHACRDIDAQAVSNTLYGVGLLAQANPLDGHLDARLISELLTRLYSCQDVHAQAVSNTLYGVGLLARANGLDGHLDARLISDLLTRLHACRDAHAQEMSSTLYGVGLLARVNGLDGHLDARLISDLLTRLHACREIDAQEMSNTLYGVGLLARANGLDGHLDARLIRDFLARLHACREIDAQHISNSIYGLGLLVTGKKLEPSADFSEVIRQLLPILFAQRINVKDASQLLFGLSRLTPGSSCPGEQLRLLFQCTMQQSYLHPRYAANLIHYMVALKAHHAVLHEEFMALLSAITISLEQFPATLRVQLQEDIDALEAMPHWRAALMATLGVAPAVVEPPQQPASQALRLVSDTPRATPLPRPTPSGRPKAAHALLPSNWATACKNSPVFDAIAAKDIKRLEQLLGALSARQAQQMKAAVPSLHVAAAPVPVILHVRPEADVWVDNKATANVLTTKFLQETDVLALRELIKRSTFSYFELLLRACSQHTRYQLAIDNALHVILLHLPMKELEPMGTSLLALGLYRDHRALLSLVDALTLRLFEHQDMPAGDSHLIVKLRNDLLTRCLEFHMTSHHRRVVPRIEAVMSKLASGAASLLEEDDFEILPARTAELVPAVSFRERGDAAAMQDVTTPQPATSVAHSRVTLFAARRPEAARRAHLPINVGYEYTAEDIEAILRARLQPYLPPHRHDLVLLAAAHMAADAHGNRVHDVLGNYLQHVAIDLLYGKRIMMPINQGAHWVGILLEVDHERRVVVTCFNSARNPIADEALLQDIRQSLSDMITHGAHVFSHVSVRTCTRSMQQDDATSCGAFLIENVYCKVKGQWWKDGHPALSLAEQIRMRHLAILADLRPDYHAGFLQRQQVGAFESRLGSP